MIAEGAVAPDFDVTSDSGEHVQLSALRGRPVVLYFYPRDDTPGCTTQACAIRDAWDDFRARGAEVFGVSIDDAAAHRAFREKFALPFPLLVDAEGRLGEAFGIARYGPERPTYRRSTVVIGADGTVARSMQDVDPATHADEVLAALS